MTLYFVPGQGVVDDQQQTLPEYGEGFGTSWGVPGIERLGTYRNPGQYADQEFQWDPQRRVFSGGIESNAPGYVSGLIGMQDRLRAGQLAPYEQEWYNRMVEESRAIPTRDIASLTAGWQGGEPGSWGHENQDWWTRLDPGSPDAGPIMLQLRDKLDRGQATPQELALYGQVLQMANDWDYRASAPQESDASPFGLGDNLFGALFTLGLGATGGLAGGALAAGGLGLGGTLGASGTLAGIGGTGAGIIGGATEQPWLQRLGSVLGAAGGLVGGVGGLANLWGTGVTSLSDAARLAQSAGRITGAVGSASGAGGLQQAGRYLGFAGQAGNLGAGAADWLGWSGGNSPLAANVAPGVDNVGNLLSAADVATQRGGGGMEYYDADFGGGDVWAGGSPTFNEGGGSYWDADLGGGNPWMGSAYQGGAGDFPGGGMSVEEQVRQAIAARPDLYGADVSRGAGGSGSWWGSLGSLASGALGFLGRNASTLGPLASTLGGVASGALGSQAARDAAAQQTAALNRGIDLQTAQWLQQQANQAPWLQAGQQALGQMQSRLGQPGPDVPGYSGMLYGPQYAMPETTPGWTPQAYQGPAGVQAGDYRWTPGQGPRAQDYRYTPGQTPDAAPYASGPPQLYQGAMPGTQVSTLTGQQVLDQDPGAAFRQSEARKALEASAAARGGLLSGSTLGALQRQSQDLASQEYGNAWQRMMARNTEQYGRDWGQYQQAWNQGVQGTQLGLQTNAQNFGQAMSAAQLREQVQQVASQQGWSQAQAEAAFREQMGQLASQQGFTQALAGQGQQWTQGLQAQQWNQQQQQQWQQEQYSRMADQAKYRYTQDLAADQSQYARQQAAYQQQLAEQARQWGQFSTLAGYGQTATNQVGNQGLAAQDALGRLYGQLGTAQGSGTIGQALPWQSTIAGATNNLPSLLRSLNA